MPAASAGWDVGDLRGHTAAPADPPGHVCGFKPAKETRHAFQGGRHVDHIYVTANVRFTSSKVVVRLRNRHPYKTPFASDHNPIRATVQIPH